MNINSYLHVYRIDHIATMDGETQYLAITCGIQGHECAYQVAKGDEPSKAYLIPVEDHTIDAVVYAYECAVEWLQAHALGHAQLRQPGMRN